MNELTCKEKKNLAARCYEFCDAEGKLFDAVNAVLGCATEECLKEGFVWGAIDTWTDEYDGSVEVVRPSNATWMTKEQADAILAMGFASIFESIGDKAQMWSRGECGPCSPREGDEPKRLKARIRALENRIKELETP